MIAKGRLVWTSGERVGDTIRFARCPVFDSDFRGRHV
jgi:hypothetical protein